MFAITTLILFFSNPTKAQPRKGDFIDVSIGIGLSAPYDEADIIGDGFYAQGEYVVAFTKWFGLRPYVGLVLTSAEEAQDYQPDYVTSNAVLLGGKIRIAAPIPWVAPYFEVGLGASIDSFKTFTAMTDIQKKGLLLHIPFTMAWPWGRKIISIWNLPIISSHRQNSIPAQLL